MNNQGFIYAVIDLFNVDDKPRLYRRNTWFRDHGINEANAVLFLMFLIMLAMAIVIRWSVVL